MVVATLNNVVELQGNEFRVGVMLILFFLWAYITWRAFP